MANSNIEDIITAISKLNVMELVDLTKAMEEKFGVSGMMNTQATSIENNKKEEVVEEKTQFDIILKSYGTNKIAVIKVVRTILGLNLKEAKTFVEDSPSLIKEKISKDEIDKLKNQLEEVGAVVEVK